MGLFYFLHLSSNLTSFYICFSKLKHVYFVYNFHKTSATISSN